MTLNKLFFIITIVLISIQFSYGQKTAIYFNAYSGVFSFRGEGSTSNSWINFNPYISPEKYTSNPYGKKADFLMPWNCKGSGLQKIEIFTE